MPIIANESLKVDLLNFDVLLKQFVNESLFINPLSSRILKNWHLKKKTKNATLNGCIPKARANSKSKLTFAENSFNFLQKSVAFSSLYRLGYMAGGSAPYNTLCRCQRLDRLK